MAEKSERGADTGKVRGSRLPNDLDERFVEYRDDRDINNAQAVRNLMRIGLEEENTQDDPSSGQRPTNGPVTLIAGTILAFTLPMTTAAFVALLLLPTTYLVLPVLSAGLLWMAVSILLIVTGTTFKIDQWLADRRTRQADDAEGGTAVATDGGVQE